MDGNCLKESVIYQATVTTEDNNPPQTYDIFGKHGLKITIEANKKIVNFLDVTLNLSSGKHI